MTASRPAADRRRDRDGFERSGEFRRRRSVAPRHDAGNRHRCLAALELHRHHDPVGEADALDSPGHLDATPGDPPPDGAVG
ncbi:hypothetical protein [Saccharothrix xinjiangensis]|uniref:Uncharacterized protein n=1 Tax=Saccharothrix xinjiangensis TaxID=204798 RepID=A0ABV9Y3Q0_9PSEU